jgi:hypothetical protein
VRFQKEALSRHAYFSVQDTIHDPGNPNELSVYRFLLNGVWHVSILGDQPDVELDEKLNGLLPRSRLFALRLFRRNRGATPFPFTCSAY